MQVGIAKRSLNDSEYSGDQCARWDRERELVLCMIDGLGHGEEAENAGKTALEYVGDHLGDNFQQIFSGADSACRSTRGAAMGIARIEKHNKTLHFAGIGNTRSLLFSRRSKLPKTLSSDRGIIGGGFRRLVPDMVKLQPGDMLVMSTDGVAERIELNGYDVATRADAEALAARILEDWGRDTDDRAVLVFIND